MSVSTSPIIIKRAKQAIADPSILERCSLGAKSEFRKLAYDGLCNPYKDEIKLLRRKLALARRAI